MQALAVHRNESRDLSQRLSAEFAGLAGATVERCVSDVRACVTHLGLDPTPALVERMAREHLLGIVKSEPPSGRTDPGARSAVGSAARDRPAR